MNVRKLFLCTLTAVAVSASGIASASSLYHDVGGEAGVTLHPDHAQSTKTRSDVALELSESLKNGSYAFLSKGAPVPAKRLLNPATREQIQQEFLSMTASDKQQLKEMYPN
jgi:hypothetical protein